MDYFKHPSYILLKVISRHLLNFAPNGRVLPFLTVADLCTNIEQLKL